MNEQPFTVCVYCGSRPGERPEFVSAAQALGAEIGRLGWRMVYGGGNVGLMGVVADSVMAAKGQVTGVIPESLLRREVGHLGLHELQVVQTMHERKHAMAERADAFVALAGGIGTFEEFFEVWTWRQLGYHQKPIALLNTIGFYDRLLAFLGQTVELGFLAADQLDSIVVCNDPVDLLARLKLPVAATVDKRTDLRKI